MEERKKREIEAREAARRRRRSGRALLVILLVLAFAGLVCAFAQSLTSDMRLARCSATAEGVGRAEVYADAPAKAAAEAEETAGTVLRVYCETDDPLPSWWDPSSAEIVYQSTPIHADSLDYNLNTTLWGWDGHGAEEWELELFAKCFYLEFWGASETCCEAGCDAMLQLWDLNCGTMFETLSHVNEDGSYAYSTFPGMWDETYDQDGLNWCTDFCMERFVNGPVWQAQYFRKGQYHDWGEWSPIPAYEICGIFFSVAK